MGVSCSSLQCGRCRALVATHVQDVQLGGGQPAPRTARPYPLAGVRAPASRTLGGRAIARERRAPDGRGRATAEDGPEVDFRASTLRTIFGEKIVMRVLEHRKGVPPLEELGFSAHALEHIRFFLRHQHGMILVVGPTGSGKTTTLCSALTSVRSERTNIITIEDPVEYQIPGVNQTPINPQTHLTFASPLPSVRPHDPRLLPVVRRVVCVGSRRARPGDSLGLVTCLRPPHATLFAWMLFHEVAGWNVMAGGTLIVGAAFYESFRA